MKILVLGDTHGRLVWLDLIEKEKPDYTIFLGDYVSSHDDISGDQQCSNLEDILNYKEENPDQVILLRGNHDLQHLRYYWAECSGYNSVVGLWMSSPCIKERFLNLTQWVHIDGNFLFSHAGISKTWFGSLGLGDSTRENLLKINEIDPCELFAFTPSRMSDYSGDSVTQPCTWIRPYSLMKDCLSDWKQVVGHTRLKQPGQFNSFESGDEIWFIDSLPQSYMIIQDGLGEMRTLEEKG